MNEILKLFLSLSVSGSIIALVLFAIKPLTKNRLSKRWQYYIWLVVILLGVAPPTVNATQPDSVNPAVTSLDGKSEAYKIIAQMAEIDTSLSISEYTNKIVSICDAANSNFFSVLADAKITETRDPLYIFATETLNYTSSELFADTGINPDERSFMSVNASLSRYETDEELEAKRGDLSDAEWNAYLNDTANDPPNIAVYKCVSYFIFYDILDKDNLTIDERDLIFNMVKSDMQDYLEGLGDEELFSDSFDTTFLTELIRVTVQYSNERMMMECEISRIEGFAPGQPLW